ncbi:MAG: two-component regulator propeller domain-containing protein [Spirochaetota bacterium]
MTKSPFSYAAALILLLCSAVIPSVVQADSAVTVEGITNGERFSFRHLNSDDGLSGDSVFCMLQDSLGYLWLGTFSGLSRYDGSRVIVYRPVPGDPESLPSSLIFDLHEDSTGTLWIASDGGGLARYSRDSGSFERFSHDPANPDSLGSDRIFSVADDAYGWIWVGTADSGLDRFDMVKGTFKNFSTSDGLPSAIVRCLLSDSAGRLWAGTTAGVARLDRDNGVFVPVAGTGEVTIRALMEDSDGSLLIGTEGRGAYRLVQGAERAARLDLGPDSDSLMVRAFVNDMDGRLWVGTEDRGLLVFDPADGSTSPVGAVPERPDSLSHDAVRALMVDRSGLVWVGTRGGGASAYNPRSRAIHRLDPQEDNNPAEMRQMIQARDGTLWLATDGGGLVHTEPDGRFIARYSHDPDDPGSLPGNRTICLAEDYDGTIWVGTDGCGLAGLAPATGRFTRYWKNPADPGSLGGDTVWVLLVDQSGQLWIGLEGGGLDRFERTEGRFSHRIPAPGDPSSLGGYSVRALLEDNQGRIWIGLWDGGLTIWDPITDQALGLYKPADDPGSLADASVTSLFEDDTGQIWVGTGGSGIDRIVESADGLFFEHLGAADGLAGSDIVGTLEDKAGRVWIVSGRGISRYERADRSIQSWGPADGFQSRFSQGSYMAIADGRFLLGGPEVIDYFMPEELTHPESPPPVVIADVSIVAHPESDPVLNSVRMRAFRAALNSGVIVLKPEDAALTLDFAVLDFVDPSRNRLSVALWGGPAERMALGSQSRAVLGGLAPGDYELRVSGSTAGGVWNRWGAVLRILVIPPFWRTPTFAAGMGMILILGIYLFIRFRTHNLERRAEQLRTLFMHIQNAREEERKTAAREVHDELGQILTAAKMDLAWLRSHPPKPGYFRERVGEALGMVDAAIDSVKSISTRLRPKALDTLSLSEALSWQLEDFRRRSTMNCHAAIDPAPEGISESAATTMFRVFQEILTNIARHSGANTVEVVFSSIEGMMVLDVLDDGRGLPIRALDSPESLGILGMRERVRHEGGLFTMESPPEGASTGTRIRVRIPLERLDARTGKKAGDA